MFEKSLSAAGAIASLLLGAEAGGRQFNEPRHYRPAYSAFRMKPKRFKGSNAAKAGARLAKKRLKFAARVRRARKLGQSIELGAWRRLQATAAGGDPRVTPRRFEGF